MQKDMQVYITHALEHMKTRITGEVTLQNNSFHCYFGLSSMFKIYIDSPHFVFTQQTPKSCVNASAHGTHKSAFANHYKDGSTD